MNKIIAIVGMPGSGKTEAAEFLVKKGFHKIRFGDVTIKEIEKRRLQVNEKNERLIRENLRKRYGMAAYAKLNLPKINKALNTSNVIIDGLYSYEECKLLREKYANKLIIIAIYASPKTRQKRLTQRQERPLTKKECEERDKAQIEKLHTGPPIAMADFTVVNECSLKDLHNSLEEVLKAIE